MATGTLTVTLPSAPVVPARAAPPMATRTDLPATGWPPDVSAAVTARLSPNVALAGAVISATAESLGGAPLIA